MINNNITNLYIIKISKWFMLFMPIIIYFYDDNGLTMTQIFTLLSVNSLVIALLEIPSGFLSDVWGRRNTMIIGVIIDFAGSILYAISYHFSGFLFAGILLGIGHSMVSGTDSAILYDTLLEKNKHKKYLRFEGIMTSLGNFAEACAGILGGLLASISLRHPFYFQIIVMFLAIPAALMLKEPFREKRISKFKISHIIKTVKYTLFEYKELSYFIFFSSIIGAATLSMAWFAQAYFHLLKIKPEHIGYLWTALNITVGISSWFAYKIEKKLSNKILLIAFIILIPSSYLLLGQYKALWAISILFFFYIVRGIATPVLKDYINRLTKSNVRATVLSIRNMIIRIIFSLLSPFYGWYTDKIDLQSTLILSGIIFFIFSFLTLIFYLRNSK